MMTTEQLKLARTARNYRFIAAGFLVFATVVLVVSFASGHKVHWSSWTMMAGFWANAASNFAGPARPVIFYLLLLAGVALLIVGVIGLIIARP